MILKSNVKPAKGSKGKAKEERRAWTRVEEPTCRIIDGIIHAEVCRNRRNNHFKPSASEVRNFLDEQEPLPVQIRFTERSLDADPPQNVDRMLLKAYFDLFLDLLPRWKAARFWASYVPWESFENRAVVPAPFLESVTVEGPSDFDMPLVSAMLSICWQASPVFSKFEMSQFNENTNFSRVPDNPCPALPITTITSLRLDCKMSVWHCGTVLAAASNLRECAFGNVTATDKYVGELFENAALQTLKIEINFEDHDMGRPTYLWRLFEFFRAPALRHVWISRDDFWSTAHFTFFIQNSGCNLEALDLFMVKMSEPELFSILSHMPFLRILKIYGDSSQDPQPVTDRVMLALTKSPQNTGLLCPRLEMFAVNDDAVGYLQDGLMSKMLLSRINAACIEYFWFESERDNEQHKFDIESLTSMAGQLEILETVVADPSKESQEEWDIAVEKKLAEALR